MSKLKKTTKAEILLVLFVVLLAGGIYGAQHFLHAKQGAFAEIVIDGEVTQRYDLNSSREVTIDTGDGGTNTLVIEDGKCWLRDANCPDKLCVKQGTISKAGQSIICLPHKLVIRISGGDASDVDVIAQ